MRKLVVLLSLMLCACEQVDLSEYLESSSTESGFAITRSVADASSLGTRLNFAVFSDGSKYTSVNQTSDESNFGTVSVSLPEGEYEYVVLVHSGTGNATITDLEAIKFTNNKVTDTFADYGTFTVSGSQNMTLEVERKVAMYRLIITGEIPSEVVQMKFYYTGGSSTYDAVNGVGIVNSRQTEYRDVTDYSEGQIFDVYTFPREDSSALKMVITALDANENEIESQTYESVPIEVNNITTHSCDFFSNASASESSTFSVKGTSEWAGNIEY